MRPRLRWVTDLPLVRGGLARVAAGSLVAPIALTAAVVLWLAAGGSRTLLISLGVSGVLVVGYQVFVGATGIVSFGHMAFVGLGAYTAGLLTVPALQKEFLLPDLPLGLAGVELGPVPAMLAGAAVAAVVALLAGAALMRATGAAAGIATLALLVIVNEVLRNATSFTRGTQTFFGVPHAASIPLVYGTLVVVVVIAVAYKFSPFGLRARAVRDDPLAAETAGIKVLPARLTPWVLSAAITGAGGALQAYELTAFSPKVFFIAQSVPIIVMTVIGGINSVAGGVAGAALLTVWLELMRHVEAGGLGPLSFDGLAQLTVGLGLILVLWLRPRGLLDARELELGPREPRRGA